MMPKAAVTLRDVAEAAGVSKTTAVYVLNNTPHTKIPEVTQRRVQDAAVRLGYRRNGIATALKRGRIQTIGAVIPFFGPSNQSSHAQMVYPKDVFFALSQAGRAHGLRVTLMPYTSDDQPAIDELTDGRVDGLILTSIGDDDFARRVYASGIACVTIGSGYAEHPIKADSFGGVLAATEHLLGLGHRRIACCVAGDGTKSSVRTDFYFQQESIAREAGFRAAVTAAGLSGKDCPSLAMGDSLETLLPVLESALRQPKVKRPTALIAYNDLYAFSIVQIAQQFGLRVPDDLSVVGFDNNIVAETCRPQITTIDNPLVALAENAIVVLQKMLKGEKNPLLPPPVPTSLIIRASTAPPVKEDEK